MAVLPADEGVPGPTGMWSTLARTRLAEILADTHRAPRAAVIGPAGADRNVLLKRVEEGLAAGGADSPLRRTLFVDDAHLLDDADITELEAHLDEPDAGLVLAMRPWPRTDRLRGILRRLEQTSPAIVLGHVDTRDVMTSLEADQRVVDEGCVAAIVHLCSSITWLVKEALAAHGDGTCADPTHEGVSRAVGEIVAERLQIIEPEVADAVRRASLGTRHHGADPDPEAASTDDAILRGHAEGLIQRNGDAVPIVRAAVLAMTPIAQMIDLLADERSPAPPADLVRSLKDVTGPRLAGALLVHAEAIAGEDVGRALELFDAARFAGADEVEVAVRMSRLAWDHGEIDDAAAFIDAVDIPLDHRLHDEAVDIVGAVWSARGYMAVSATTFGTTTLTDLHVRSHAVIAAFGAGELDPLRRLIIDGTAPSVVPTTRSVSMRMLLRGLVTSVSDAPPAAIVDFIRASDTYTESREAGPTPEVPAVIAALAAIGAGELATAHTVLGDALLTGHGGAWARPRLLLWSAWVAVHRQLPEEAAARLAEVDAGIAPLGVRDTLLRDAVLLAFVRRFGAVGELQVLWERVRDDVRRVEPDLFSLLPLCEFLVTSTVFADADRDDPVLTSMRTLLSELDDPPLWTADVVWVAFQREVVAGNLDAADAYAEELKALRPLTAVVRAVSAAAIEWSRARRESEVDAERIASVTEELAAAGLAWDAARLAHLASAHTTDRKAASRLAALARELHPNVEHSADAPAEKPMRSTSLLSPRELEVAALVLGGKTYAEIGERIFISPRTAEHHIARIRQRLGATSRTDLIAKLQAIVEVDTEGK